MLIVQRNNNFLKALKFFIYFLKAGKHGYELVTGYLKYITLALILAFELFAVAWIYCAHSLGRDLKTMLDSTCCWCFGHFLLFFNYLLPAVPIVRIFMNPHLIHF
jgi:hypothetical protein